MNEIINSLQGNYNLYRNIFPNKGDFYFVCLLILCYLLIIFIYFRICLEVWVYIISHVHIQISSTIIF